MNRLIEKIVFSGFITAWRLATVPTSRSPPSVKATTDGVVRPPSAFSSTVGSPPSITATQELVVPRSMPIVLPTCCVPPGVSLIKPKKSKCEYGRSYEMQAHVPLSLPHIRGKGTAERVLGVGRAPFG